MKECLYNLNMDDINLQIKNTSGIRTGKQYLEGLRDDRNIWMHGNKVDDVTKQDGLRRCAETLATFLDNQHHTKYINNLTYIDDDGDRCAIAFKIPKSKKVIGTGTSKKNAQQNAASKLLKILKI